MSTELASLNVSNISGWFRRLARLPMKVVRGDVPTEKERILKRFRRVGAGVEISETISLVYPERITLGDHIYIGPHTRLEGQGELLIEDHVIIGPEVVVMTALHNYKNATMVPYDDVELLKPVTIEQCVWIGMRAIIMPGVTIGEGSVIGTGAVVTKSCEPGSVLGGNPAQLIATRDMDHYRDCVKRGRFYVKLKQDIGFEKTEFVAQDLVGVVTSARQIQ